MNKRARSALVYVKVGGKEFPNVISDPQSSKEILSQENNLEN